MWNFFNRYDHAMRIQLLSLNIVSLRLSFMVRVASVQPEVIKVTNLHVLLHKILQKYFCDI